MSSQDKTLRNICKRVKICNIVIMRGVEGYEPSYKGLKLWNETTNITSSSYEPSYKGLKLALVLFAFSQTVTNLPIRD